jgi:hypothetical protein
MGKITGKQLCVVGSILFIIIAMTGCDEQFGLQMKIHTNKTSYQIGEIIHVSLVVINTYNHPFQLNMTGNSTYEVLIYNATGQLVYGRNYWDVWGQFNISAKSAKTVVENYTWNQTNSADNTQVPHGMYIIHAKIFYFDNNKTMEIKDVHPIFIK